MGRGNSFQIQTCRGLQGACSNSLWGDPSVVREVQEVLGNCSWLQVLAGPHGRGPVPRHAQFKVALAACPNACTLPQIQDIGIIATLTPQAIGPECTGCGACRRICREDAIAMSADRAELRADRCVGCGACIRTCPYGVIEASTVQLRVLVGGRMGRHPRWAEQLCLIDPPTLSEVLRTFLEIAATEAPAERRAAGIVEKIGIEQLRRRVWPIACNSAVERGP